MKATRNLEDDHVYIQRLIDVMEHLTLKQAQALEPVEEIVELIRKFADGMHHAKEEKLLFPLMVEKGFSTTQGPVAVMLSDHVQGREYVRQISDGIVRFRSGENNAWVEIQNGMKGYIELLRGHIYKENNILFRMADNVMDKEEQLHLLLEFNKIDQGSGDQTSENYIARIYKLVKEQIG
jgi:hemerythrin-like domain-containing protein